MTVCIVVSNDGMLPFPPTLTMGGATSWVSICGRGVPPALRAMIVSGSLVAFGFSIFSGFAGVAGCAVVVPGFGVEVGLVTTIGGGAVAGCEATTSGGACTAAACTAAALAAFFAAMLWLHFHPPKLSAATSTTAVPIISGMLPAGLAGETKLGSAISAALAADLRAG